MSDPACPLRILFVGALAFSFGCAGGSPDSAAGAGLPRPDASQAGAAAGSAGSAARGPLAIGPATPLARRLTRDELANTLGDSLGTELSEVELTFVPKDRPLEGFVNTATSQTVSPEHVTGYASVARTVSARLDSSFVTAHSSCQSATPECHESFVTSAGKLLFRRPLDAEEVGAFAAAFQRAMTEDLSFVDAARHVVEAMLQAPQFLYRLEKESAAASALSPSQARPVTGYEMATRLSYLVWESAPDAALQLAAEAGTLDSSEGVERQLARLLQEPRKTRRATQRFLTDWAKLESLPDSELRSELVSSLQAFYADFVWSRGRPLMELFTAPHAFLTPRLAANYGLPPGADGIVEYDLSPHPGRLGLLTQPGFVAGMTNADGGVIVARGLFLQSQLFCQATPSPPTGLQEAIDQFVAAQPPNASARDIADVRLQRPECGACHQTFDPLAYGLEQFDFEGRFRERDALSNPLRSDGWIPARLSEMNEQLPYAGVEDYMRLLSQSPSVGACIARQHLQYALGRRLSGEQEPLAQELFAEVTRRGGTYPALLAAIVRQPLFRELTLE